MLGSFLNDRKSRIPRVWSNRELEQFAGIFQGDIVNVSGWEDKDKEGRTYSEYFTLKTSYTITNYLSEARGLQGKDNEIFLDLTQDLPDNLHSKYDVVFNHTVLEHIFEIDQAFKNLCMMSRDIVILVVPFLQPMHADYGDYWRFTPSCIQKMFNKHGMSVLYCSFNNPVNASVYVFCIATKHKERWASKINGNLSGDGTVQILSKPVFEDGQTSMVGANSIMNIGPWLSIKYSQLKKYLSSSKTEA